jgi:hypothetical protein
MSSVLWRRLRALFRRRELDRELDDEVRLHLEQKVQEGIGAGLSPEEARYAARREFRNPTLWKEVRSTGEPGSVMTHHSGIRLRAMEVAPLGRLVVTEERCE